MRKLSVVISILGLILVFSLSGVAGRLFGIQEKPSALSILLLAVVLVIVNLLLIRRVSETPRAKWLAEIAYIILVLGVGVAVAYYAYSNTPPLMAESVGITVTVENVEATDGHVEANVQYRALKGGLNHLLWGRLGATGVIKNVKTRDLQVGYRSEVTEVAGEWQLNLIFPESLKKGQRFTFSFEFDVRGSPPEENVYWIHSVTEPTQNLAITIIVPSGRPCRGAMAQSEDTGHVDSDVQTEQPPLLWNDNTKLTWTQANPRQGRSYKVICY
jgi:hypothetical protein